MGHVRFYGLVHNNAASPTGAPPTFCVEGVDITPRYRVPDS